MRFKKGDIIYVQEIYLHKEIAGCLCEVDHIDDGSNGDAYFIKNETDTGWYEVPSEYVECGESHIQKALAKKWGYIND